ncbi:MAG: arylesterase [Planctomycetes bacterium]|jgi:lysophospholipase L1-like esterase|nr:arylesterase [Planctomycetota bacterium]MDP6129359.1 SGNH/GDSL hydrolase family protein [Planctomycetota bacterium]MDP7246431.1 SGNH/GDSL hydrolase family protein [Planctomycetota bacterium]|tara:strand:+ start:49 stop:675 length:627 start_codon:yes stop_codon:yes gene_type:complete
MKNILCFGDSNTWGYTPITGERYAHHVRWTGVLRNSLGKGYWIVEEGLNGRTTVHNEKERPFRSGLDLFPVILESHAPIDLVVLMLGTNDLKSRFNRTEFEISMDIKSLCKKILGSSSEANDEIKILLVPPPPLNTMPDEDGLEFTDAIQKSLGLANLYQSVSEDLGIHFLDAGKIVKTNTLDGVHWDESQHQDFGEAISRKISSILG